MNSLETIENITNTNLIFENLKYCLVSKDKIPFNINGKIASPNNVDDFVDFDKLIEFNHLRMFAGVGISIQASNICAIDVDHCFINPNDIYSGDERAKNLLEEFKDTYCEFSFSGTGLRILFRLENIIENYNENFYIKNKNNQIEFYQPNDSYRYVTITGRTIYDNCLKKYTLNQFNSFLYKYMKKEKTLNGEQKIKPKTAINDIVKQLKYLYLTNQTFQDLWFSDAPGSGKDESERDYQIIAFLYENITEDKEKIKELFESSYFFKTKDDKHIKKWEFNNFRYFNYIYDCLEKTH